MGNKVSIKVPKSSGKNLSHRNNITGQVGTLVPLLCREPVVGERCHMSLAIDLNLPPLASKTYANIDYKVEAFFVPFRILVGGFEDWFSGANLSNYSPASRPCLPAVQFNIVGDSASAKQMRSALGRGTLSDCLGNKIIPAAMESATQPYVCTAMKYLAYHRIYDDWYRNPQVQQKVFQRLSTSGSPSVVLSASPWLIFNSLTPVSGINASRVIDLSSGSTFRDGVRLYDFRQRNFGFDYFTQATPNPQLGTAPSITVGSTMSISQIRAANSMQLWQERNVIAGPRLVDAIKARYGVDLSDGVAQRPLYLGSASFNVYSNGIYQTQVSPSTGGVQTSNPFDSIGAQYGSVSCQGSQLLIDDFTAKEPGYIMVLGSLVPRATYGTGLDKSNQRYITGPDDVAEMASPLLQNIGNEPIFQRELNGVYFATETPTIFGYVPRYTSWNCMLDEVHGKFTDGEELQSFLCQRSFNGSVTLSSSFLQIPTDFLDQIFAVEADKGFGYWLDCFFDYRVSNCLADFAIPSLQDPAYEHGRSVSVDFGGTSL